MVFPLGSLRPEAGPSSPVYRRGAAAKAAAPEAPPRPRWQIQIGMLLAALLLGLYVLALATHSPLDEAWSTSGASATLHNQAGAFGAWLSDLAYFSFGFSSWWLVPVALRGLLGGVAGLLRQETAPAPEGPAPRPAWTVGLGFAMLLCASAALEWTRLYQLEPRLPGHSGGVVGYLLGPASMRWLGFTGSGAFWIVGIVIGMPLALRFSWLRVAEALGAWLDGLRLRGKERRESRQDRRLGEQARREREVVLDKDRYAGGVHAVMPAEAAVAAPAPPVPPAAGGGRPPEAPRSEVPGAARTAAERPRAAPAAAVPAALAAMVSRQAAAPLPPAGRRLPKFTLLDPVKGRPEGITPDTLEMTSRLIEKRLKDFGVEVRVVAAAPGPVITRYEIEPATGVKGSQVVNLAKDLARSLSLVSIRVVETIPGKNLMALELPNPRRQSIRLVEILDSSPYREAESLLSIALGKDIVGQPIVADLARMPHLLVAGTTGSGKSVGINAMILSLLFKAEARDVRLLMIDPKMLEMAMYEGIPHLLAPVVTDMKQAANALSWCVGEMERRYKLMSKMGVRNLAGYNRKLDEARERGELIPNPFSLTPEQPEPLDRLPYIVVVIDELADLMMVVGKKIEELIARLAQKARAAGIHLVLATQRPSVDVITGLIKANIPTRIAFQVSSKIDSRTILDQMGAEALLGQGDMLYLAPGTGLPTRVHGAFVSDEEVHRVVEYLKSLGEPDYIEGILEGGVLEGEGGAAGGAGGGNGEADPMYDQAVAIVLQHRRASISLVQRHLRIGYNRAARLLEQMEKSGLVSAMANNGNRDLLVPVREE